MEPLAIDNYPFFPHTVYFCIPRRLLTRARSCGWIAVQQLWLRGLGRPDRGEEKKRYSNDIRVRDLPTWLVRFPLRGPMRISESLMVGRKFALLLFFFFVWVSLPPIPSALSQQKLGSCEASVAARKKDRSRNTSA